MFALRIFRKTFFTTFEFGKLCKKLKMLNGKKLCEKLHHFLSYYRHIGARSTRRLDNDTMKGFECETL